MVALMMISAVVLAGCGNGKDKELQEGKLNVIVTFYPLYDFAVKIGGEHVHVINMVPAGVEPHDWSPKSRDVSRMGKAGLFVYQGSGFEGWVDDFLKSLPSDNKLQVVETSKGMSLLQGSDEEEEVNPNHIDPHTWLSPQSAKQMAARIKDGMIQADPANKSDYESNFAKLTAQFDQLDAKYRAEISKTPRKDIVVSHNAFAYLCRDYGLTQKSIMGLSPDAEPTAKAIKDINDFVKANQVKYIFFEELVSNKLAKTLAKDAGIETLVLNPLEGLTPKEAKAGADYFTVMEANLQNLLKALQ